MKNIRRLVFRLLISGLKGLTELGFGLRVRFGTSLRVMI